MITDKNILFRNITSITRVISGNAKCAVHYCQHYSPFRLVKYPG